MNVEVLPRLRKEEVITSKFEPVPDLWLQPVPGNIVDNYVVENIDMIQ